MSDQGTPGDEVGALVEVVRRLLADDGGCQWNRDQTPESLVTYLVEETAELVEAIEQGTIDDRREELGDVLYQVVLHSALAERDGAFSLADVVRDVSAKTVRRHPHVFGGDEAADVDEIIRLWSAAKAREKAHRDSVFDGVAVGLPALARAQKIDARRRAAMLPGSGSIEVGPSPSTDPHPGDDVELAFGREVLRLIDALGDDGVDAERAVRRAVREREELLRDVERRVAGRREDGMPRQPE